MGVLSFDVTKGQFFWASVICLISFLSVTIFDNISYPLFMHPYYTYYTIFVKCASNQISYNLLNRSLKRNYFFNLMRNVVKPTLFPLIYVGYTDPHRVLNLAIAVFLMTYLFQHLNLRIVSRFKYLWTILHFGYLMSNSIALITMFNRAQNHYNGNAMAFFLAWFGEVHFSIIGHAFEDLVFGDLNYFGWSLIQGFHIPYLIATFIIFFLQFMLYGEGLKFNSPQSIYDFANGHGHIQNYQVVSHNDIRAYPIYFYSNLVFALSILHSNLRTYQRLNSYERSQIKVEKKIQEQPIEIEEETKYIQKKFSNKTSPKQNRRKKQEQVGKNDRYRSPSDQQGQIRNRKKNKNF
ncbi:UNKNOWN [Stylonychia lemnae]|uniref:Transmembrane protein n=1 Tax=Stylonychia lemnae TaxID=5949 RepID=A0A078B5H5_STYLE|nr:UNKNOWN [Stylonychia lemnae]|eukprot:CDW88552.1 UNKNOWN [Stylonychia lemnae]